MSIFEAVGFPHLKNKLLMFGLMHHVGCSVSPAAGWHRLHYCGTCKTLGAKYGQMSRMVLNRDAVFLAELLSLISREDITHWDPTWHSYNCLSPTRSSAIPGSLDYAADVNMLFASIKLRDQKKDGIPFVWNIIGRWLRGSFSRLHAQLRRRGVEVARIQHWLEQQRILESQPLSIETDEAGTFLTAYAYPTAQITGYLFAQGAEQTGRIDLYEAIFDLGVLFGEIVYVHDAITDIDEDQRTGQFNPLLLLENSGYSSDAYRETGMTYVWNKMKELEPLLAALGLAECEIKSIAGRMMFNLTASFDKQFIPSKPASSGIEKATVPRIKQAIRSLFTLLNPAYPRRFAWTYLTALILCCHQQISQAIDLVIKPSSQMPDWTFLWLAAVGPILGYLIASRIKLTPLLSWLIRQKDRIKRKISDARQKKPKKWWEWILIVLGLLLLAFIVMVLIIAIVSLIVLLRVANECQSSDC